VRSVTVRPILADEVGRFNAELDAHHWLGHRLTGQVLRYVAVLDGEWVALVGFGSAALSCAARDRFLGWSREAQYARLRHVVHNQRFCMLPAGGRPNLASAVLARVLRRLAGDYLTVYGHVLAALPEPRRLECKRLAPDLLLNKLYWVDLGNIIARNWQQFERFFNDKRRFQSAWELVNDRPDAHAKEADLADIALQRREITWLEERITK